MRSALQRRRRSEIDCSVAEITNTLLAPVLNHMEAVKGADMTCPPIGPQPAHPGSPVVATGAHRLTAGSRSLNA